MKPVIAMPLPGTSLFRMYMISKYLFSLRRAGARVRLIPLGDPEKATRKALTCDGLLMPGGQDVEPALYGQVRSEKCNEPSKIRDVGEWKMLEAFLPTQKPVLGICRGIQLLNVVQGGTLHQDIGHLQQCSHDDFPNRAKGVHDVAFVPGTQLAAIFGTPGESVNTMHHQAVDRLGNGLTLSARSSDGICEAVELEGHPFCIGVQWHPEHMSHNNAQQRKLFSAFVAACRR